MGDLHSQTLMTCPHCGDDFLINEAGDGSISAEIVVAPPQMKRGAGTSGTPISRTTTKQSTSPDERSHNNGGQRHGGG